MGHTGLNKTLHLIEKHPTGFCDHCQDGTHTMSLPKVHHRKRLRNKVLRKLALTTYLMVIISYLRRAGLLNRIILIIIIMIWEVVDSGPHSSIVGGSNAPYRWMLTAIKAKKKKKNACL